ncbi:MAG: arylsulfatase [Verrucomicrobiae bacterium]|nr:arylsulfatase [Verrucomicrobiae bacterium]MCP5541763.1 arylsulfatase [Akkermansiaceae bacterium]
MKFPRILHLGAVAVALAFSTVARAAGMPNIVFIMADDLGYAELGCYGQAKIRTPRIDALAAQGMRFTRNYCGNAVCAPSRCVLMTGKHPGHAEVRNNRSMIPLGEPEGQHPLPAEEVTIAEILRREGYATGAFGKWGLGNMQSTGSPLKQGFDRFFGYNCQSHAHSYYPETLWDNDTKYPLGNVPPIPGHASLADGADPNDPRGYDLFKGQDYAPARINEQVLQFIRDHRDGPFFCYYPTIIPHVALHVPDAELAPYLAEKWTDPPFTRQDGHGYTPHFTPRAAYAAMISMMDKNVGKVLDLLDELHLAEDTIVVFTSDNGTTHLDKEVDFEFFDSVANLRGLKGSLYEGGVRVPLIVRWPGKVEAGGVSDFVTGFEDWLPTLLDLISAKTTAPGNTDGVSIAPTLLGQGQAGRDFLYREFAGYGGQQAVWLGDRWKGVRQDLIPKGKKKGAEIAVKTELYDLLADESESKDLAAENPEVLAKIEALMKSERVPSETFAIPVLDGK